MSSDIPNPFAPRPAQTVCESIALFNARMVVGDEKLAQELFSPPYDRSPEERREFMRRHSNQLAGMYGNWLEGRVDASEEAPSDEGTSSEEGTEV